MPCEVREMNTGPLMPLSPQDGHRMLCIIDLINPDGGQISGQLTPWVHPISSRTVSSFSCSTMLVL